MQSRHPRVAQVPQLRSSCFFSAARAMEPHGGVVRRDRELGRDGRQRLPFEIDSADQLHAKSRRIRYALSNSFAFGGANAALVFGPP